MTEDAAPEPETEPISGRAVSARDVYITEASGGVRIYQNFTGPVDASGATFATQTTSSIGQTIGSMRIEIHGSWSVGDLIKLFGHLEDGYKAAAALERLAIQSTAASAMAKGSQPTAVEGISPSVSADDLLQQVTIFQLAGGLRLGSLQYGSPGFLEVIGALNPLKTIKDGITENREINSKRDEVRGLDEREREQQAMHHEENMAREARAADQQRQAHALEVAKLQIEAEAARFSAMNSLIDRLPPAQQSATAAQLIQLLMGATGAIANDSRIDGVTMLEQGDRAISVQAGAASEAGNTPSDVPRQ